MITRGHVTVVKGELVQILRASSDQITFEEVSKKLCKHFHDGEYPKRLLFECVGEVPFSTRPHHLQDRVNNLKESLSAFWKNEVTYCKSNLLNVSKEPLQETSNIVSCS